MLQEKLRMPGSEKTILSTALSRGIHTFSCSSVGRLFDAVSALLGLCWRSSFEGQAALLLEEKAHQGTFSSHQYEIPLLENGQLIFLDWRPMIAQMFIDVENGVEIADISLAFHEALSQSIVKIAEKIGENKVLLTGGVMQNKLLVEKSVLYLRAAGFEPYIHKTIPPNDSGISVGQIIGKLHVLGSTG